MSRLRFSKLPAKERAKMAAAIRSGERVSEIAKAFGVSRRTVYNHKAQVEEVDLQSRTAVLTVRLNKQDVEDLDKLAEREQLTRAETARRVLLRSVDVFQPEPTEAEALRSIGVELAKIGSNLNQISNAIHSERKFGGLKSTDALEDALDRVDVWSREIHQAANLVRYKILMRSKKQKLRNEEIFALLGDAPEAAKGAVEAPQSVVEASQGAPEGEAAQEGNKRPARRSLAQLRDKITPRQATLFKEE